ncbi:MAG TPA: rod shape-determining protein MreC, partial [Blastocatellia bacterium]|nr:rod shape-determining protein MreC [Blastocatellia bacterium]
MSARTAQQKAPGVLVVLLILQFVLMSMSARHPNGSQSMLTNWLMAALTPVVKTGEKLIDGIGNAAGNLSELRNARDENVRLRQQVEELTAQRDSERERADRFAPLADQLGFRSDIPYTRLAANVISREAGNWFRTLIIDRGTLDGVKLSMPVVTATGIVGRVIELGPNYARVQVITDQYAGVGAMLERSRAKGQVKGIGADRCELRNVSASEHVEAGEAVVTTGLDGIYPKGLMV